MRNSSVRTDPLVSVVIPAYNHASYLDEAIQSVLGQDYANVELIVIDDGSTDKTREVLQKYDGWFYWESQDNMGQSATLNKGWGMSRGEILAYLSPDDVLMPRAVGRSVERLLADPEAAGVYCDFDLIYADSTVARRVYAPEFDYREMAVKFVCPPGPGAFFHRGAFEATGGWNGSVRRIPDYDFWLRLGLQGRLVRIPEVLAAFRVHEGSITFGEPTRERSEEYVRVISDYYEQEQVPPEVLAAKDEALSNAYIFAARAHFRSRRYGKGLARLSKGLSLYPRNLSLRTLKIIAHGFASHVRHRAAQRITRTVLSKVTYTG